MENYYNTDVIDVENLEIKLNSFIIIASKRASGKTILVKALIKNICDNNEIDNIILFSKTAMFNGDYDFIDKKYVYDYDKSEDIIKKIMNYQKEKIKKFKNKKEKIQNILIIFDDVNISKKNLEIVNISVLGRHFKITTILSVQYPKTLCNSAIRCNFNYIFFNDLNYEGEEAILKSIHVPFKYNEFHNFIDKYNNNYNFIMYDNNEKDKKKRIKIIHAPMYENLEFI